MAMGGSTYCPSYLILLLLMVMQPLVIAAPYLKTATGGSHIQQQQQPPLDHLFKPEQGLIGPLYRHNDYSMNPPTSGSCLYQLRHYEEGDRIITNEPCLNCTCHNSMLMCYLKVCPFSKPIGQDCKVEKSPNQCCPVITCPQVRVNLQVMQMTSTTTLSPTSTSDHSSGLVPYSPHGCTIEDQYYSDGVQVPGNPREPCELCYCIRNHTTCVMQECVLKIPGCQPVFEDGICCPVRYSCEYDDHTEQAITTTTMTPNGTLLTTTLQPPEHAVGCMHNGDFYADGAEIPSENACEHCYCMKADIICAIQECVSTLAEKDENCTPRPPLPGKCCPESYDCLDVPISASAQRDRETLEQEQETILEEAAATTDSILETVTFSEAYDTKTQDTSSVEIKTSRPKLSEVTTSIMEDLPYKESHKETFVEDKTSQPDVAIDMTTAVPSVKLPHISDMTTKLTESTSAADEVPQTELPDIFADARTTKPEVDTITKSGETTSIPLEGFTTLTKIPSLSPSVTDSTLIDSIPDMEFTDMPSNITEKDQPDVGFDMVTDRTTVSPLEYPKVTSSTDDYKEIIDLETRTTTSGIELSTEKILSTTAELVPGISNDTYTELPKVIHDKTSTDRPDTKFDSTTTSKSSTEKEPHFTSASIEPELSTYYIPADFTIPPDEVASFKPEIVESFTPSSEDDLYTETIEKVSISKTTIQPATGIDFISNKTTPLPLEILHQTSRGSTISPITETTVDDGFPYSEKVSGDERKTTDTSKVTITPAYSVNTTEEGFPMVTTRTDDIYYTGPPDRVTTEIRTAQPEVDIDETRSITTESPEEKHIYITEAPESFTTIHELAHTKSPDIVSFDTSTSQSRIDSDTTTLKTISQVSNITTLSPLSPGTSISDDEYYTQSPETVYIDMRTDEIETDMQVSTSMVDTIPDHKITTTFGESTEKPSKSTPSIDDEIDTGSPEMVSMPIKTTPISLDFSATTLTANITKDDLSDFGQATTELPEAINITAEEFPYTDTPEEIKIETRTSTTSDELTVDPEAVLGESSTMQQDMDSKSTTSSPSFSGIEVEKHLTTEDQIIDISQGSKTNITELDVDTRYTPVTELPEFDITKLETEISETTEAIIKPAVQTTAGKEVTIKPAAQTTPGREATSELPISDGISSDYTTVPLDSEMEKTTTSIDETTFVTKLSFVDTEEPIDHKYVTSTLPTDILKELTTKSPGDVSVGPEVEIDAIAVKPTMGIFEKETIPHITTKGPVIDDGKTTFIKDDTPKASTATSIPIRDESLSQIEFTSDLFEDIDTTTKTLPPSKQTTEDLSFGLDEIIDSQLFPDVTQITAISTTGVTRTDDLYTESPLPTHTQGVQPEADAHITTSKPTTKAPDVKLPETTKILTELSPSHRNVTLVSVSDDPERYLTTSIPEHMPGEVTKSDYVTEDILKDDAKEITKTQTAITPGDEIVTELPIISRYPEYKPPSKPEILDHLSPEVITDSIELDVTTESVGLVTKSLTTFDKIDTIHKELINQTGTTLSVESMTDFKQRVTTDGAITLSPVSISENTTQDTEIDVTSTISIKLEDKDDDIEATMIEKDEPILAVFDEETATKKIQVSSVQTTSPYEGLMTSRDTPKVPSIPELSTMDPSKVMDDIDKFDSTTIGSTLQDELLRQTTKSPIQVQEFTDKLPSRFDVTISDDTFDPLVTTPGFELSSPSSPAIKLTDVITTEKSKLTDAITTEKSDVDSPEQKISETEATTIEPREEFTSQAGITIKETTQKTEEEEERQDTVTILQDYITSSPISPDLLKCDQVTCQPPPPTFLGCRERKTPEDCCPFYDCPVIFPDDEFRPPSLAVTMKPKPVITLSKETEIAKDFTTIKPTSEEKIGEQIPQDDKRPIFEPEIMDKTIVTKDEEMSSTPDYQPAIDSVKTTPFSDENVTKSSVMADTFEGDLLDGVTLSTKDGDLLEGATISTKDDDLIEGVTISTKDDTAKMTTKIFGDTETRLTTSTLIMDIKDLTITTPASKTVKDTDSSTTVLETVDDMYQTTTSFIDKPEDKIEGVTQKDSTVTEGTLESDYDIIATTKRIDYEESSLPSIKPKLDQTTVKPDFSESTYVTETSVDKKVISNVTTGDDIRDDVESSTHKTSMPFSDKTIPSLSEIDTSMSTQFPDMVEETFVKMSSTIISPVDADDDAVTSEITGGLALITVQPTDGTVTQKLFVDETTPQEIMVTTEDPEIKASDISSTDQPIDGVSTDREIDETRDGVTSIKHKITTQSEVTTPSTFSFTTGYTTFSSSLPEEKIVTDKMDTYHVESTSEPQLFEMDVPTSSTQVDDDFMETKPFDEKTEATGVVSEEETTGAPGEGLCTYNRKIYSNGESVPVSSPCQQECKCSHSVISCQAIKCSPPPPTFLRCEVKQTSNECCPFYECPIQFPPETESETKYEKHYSR